MSEAYGMYDPPPAARGGHGHGADRRRGGRAPGSITAETRSRDTIGNIWFTKPLLGDPAGQHVTVVTSTGMRPGCGT
jgi:uncharacterized SAM-binding protein YcdF (DUF218 family)